MFHDRNLAAEISVRDRRYTRHAMAHRWWMVGDPFGTVFYNALSAGFPKGECFVVDSVRRFRDGTPPKLAAEIAAFIGQEAIHSREHRAFNRRVDGAGYDMSTITAAVDRRLAAIRAKSPIACLSAATAIEHLTAVLAHEVLANPRHFAKAEPEAAAMWRWHALEEIEHKAVSFDTWLHATRGWSPFKRWIVKAKVLPLVTRNILVDRFVGAIEMLRQDGRSGLAPRIRLFWYLFGWPGLLRRVFWLWAGFLMPGFHPWNHDNRALLEATRKSLSTEAA